MLIWLASYPRSGNTLLRIVLKRCFDLDSYSVYESAACHEETGEVVSGMIGRRFVDDGPLEPFLERARSAAEPVLVKTHESAPADDRVLYLVRDGRAVIASYQNYLRNRGLADRSLEQLIAGEQWPGAWAEHVASFLGRDPGRTLWLRYEQLTAREGPPLAMLAALLGREPRRPFDVSFSELRRLDPGFFHTGSDAPGIERVERECSGLFWERSGDVMRRLGYGAAARAS